MKFFIPQKEDEVQTNTVWQATKKFAEKTLNWKVSDRRIFSMAYKHNGRDEYVEVGKPNPGTGEIVIAILESNTCLVCTLNRGVVRDMPILVGKEEAYRVTDFDS